jgi:hypothetical protein
MISIQWVFLKLAWRVCELKPASATRKLIEAMQRPQIKLGANLRQ